MCVQVVVWAVDQGNTTALIEEMGRLNIHFEFCEERGDDGKGKIKKWTQLSGEFMYK